MIDLCDCEFMGSVRKDDLFDCDVFIGSHEGEKLYPIEVNYVLIGPRNNGNIEFNTGNSSLVYEFDEDQIAYAKRWCFNNEINWYEVL